MQLIVRPCFIFSCPRARVGFPSTAAEVIHIPPAWTQIPSPSATGARCCCPTLSWADMLWAPTPLPSAQSTSRLDRSLYLPPVFCRHTSPTEQDQTRLQLSSVAKIKLYFKSLPAPFKIISQFAFLALVLIVDT